MSCVDAGRDVLMLLTAPLAFSASMTAEMKAKVVRTRPGWMGDR